MTEIETVKEMPKVRPDLMAHFICWAVLAGVVNIASYAITGSIGASVLLSWTVAMGVGYLKERTDKTGFSKDDLLFDLYGTMAGIFVTTAILGMPIVR